MSRHTRALLLMVLFAVAALIFPTAAMATFPGTNGRIAFIRAGNVWVMNPDGTGQIRLTTGGVSADPRWSADGRKIAFSKGDALTSADIWVMNADGSGSYQVTHNTASDAQPAWSPNGAWLAFSSDRNGHPEIFKIRSTAPFGTPVRLTHTAGTGEPDCYTNPYLADFSPNWSPLGNRITFTRYYADDCYSSSGWAYLLYTMNTDGSGLREANGLGGHGPRQPNWGPGGAKIAWTDSAKDYDFDFYSDNVWQSKPDGTALVQVTHFPTDGVSPHVWALGGSSWSPYRGTLIVFSGVDTSTTRLPAIYRVASSGSSSPVLIANNGQDPDWGPAPS